MRESEVTRPDVSRRRFLHTAAVGSTVAALGPQPASLVTEESDGESERPLTEAERLFQRHAGEFGGKK